MLRVCARFFCLIFHVILHSNVLFVSLAVVAANIDSKNMNLFSKIVDCYVWESIAFCTFYSFLFFFCKYVSFKNDRHHT